MVLFLVIVFLVWALVYLGWFFGRVHEATVEDQEAQLDEAAYRWAVQNGRLPSQTLYVDRETGEIL